MTLTPSLSYCPVHLCILLFINKYWEDVEGSVTTREVSEDECEDEFGV